MTDDRAVADLDERPSTPVRWLAALPLFFLYASCVTILVVAQRLKSIFLEMDFGELPAPTRVLFSLCNFATHFYYFVPPLMFLATWFFFSWSCRNRRRMLWSLFGIGIAGLVLFFGSIIAIIMAFLYIFDRLNSTK